MRMTFAARATCAVALVIAAAGDSLAHEIVGVTSYSACRRTQATAFLRSPNPGALNQDHPLQVVDAAGTPTGEHIVVLSVQNASDFDARVTAMGFAWGGQAGGFELVELFRTYNQLTINNGGVRRGTIGPLDYRVVPSVTIPQSPSVVLSIRHGIHGVPAFPHTSLTMALVTGNTFAGGEPRAGLGNDGLRHVIAFKGILPAGGADHIETLLDDSYVRFRQVGVDGEGSETGILLKHLPSISCP